MAVRLIPEEFRAARIRAGLSQEKAGEQAGKSRKTVYNIEKGEKIANLGIESLAVWGAALGCPDHTLIGYSHPPDVDLPDEARKALRQFYELLKATTSMTPDESFARVREFIELLQRTASPGDAADDAGAPTPTANTRGGPSRRKR
jgi:transcriptional regulator with XRE-family HTH domain